MSISCTSQYTTTIIIALASELLTILVQLIAVVITAICTFVRNEKKPQREESDVYLIMTLLILVILEPPMN